MNRFHWLLLAILLIARSAVAQSQPQMEDVVYLKNGGTWRGTIIEQVPNQSLKIETVGRNVIVLTFDQIERIVKEPVQGTPPPADKPTKQAEEATEIQDADYDRGMLTLYIMGNIGYLSNAGSFTGSSGGATCFGGTLAAGFNPHPKFSVGLGGGYDGIGHFSLIPVFVDLHYFMTTRHVTPYVSGSFGYSVGPEEYNDGGFYAHPRIGVRYNFARRSALAFGIGARYQGFNVRVGWSGLAHYDTIMGVLHIGAIF